MVGCTRTLEMPLTSYQREVMAVVSLNRSEESHVAGGIVLNAGDDSPRFSQGFDFFHETAEAVKLASEQDRDLLEAHGFTVVVRDNWEKATTFRQAIVRRGSDAVRIDWAADSAVRYFPIERDPVLGWRLHLFDMATNKALALSARTETRDYIDIVELGQFYRSGGSSANSFFIAPIRTPSTSGATLDAFAPVSYPPSG